MKSKVAELVKMPYIRMIVPDPDGGFVGEIKELPGCLTQGETQEETLANLNEAMELWLEAALKQGLTIPEPESERAYSGKLLLRLPKSLHGKLADAAEADGVSINQWIVNVLSENIGRKNRNYSPEMTYYNPKEIYVCDYASNSANFVPSAEWKAPPGQLVPFRLNKEAAR